MGESCTDDNTIAALLSGELTAARRTALTAHIDTCAACRLLVGDLVRTATDNDAAAAPILPTGAMLGRYVVHATIGAGAMGVVYAAFDPELGRKVALKLLRPDAGGSEVARARLLREAQTLAKLAHPHVIAIHDVGTFGGEVFLAMELVDGGTLADWLAAAPRTWREIVRTFAQIGAGLAAAHAAGLVHRDLKPDNILIGTDDRAHVTDFGLSRDAATPTPPRDDAALPATLDLSISGAMIGTPAYMAPEQLARRSADAASDQFSYCVTFYEALYGERPFDGVDRGAIRPPPRGRRVPAWLRRLVCRGLAVEPAARWPSLRALLAALARGPLVTPRRLAIAGGAIVGAIAIAVAMHDAPAHAPVCTGADAAWGTTWNASTAATVRHAFATAIPDGGNARATADRVERLLGDTADSWRALHTDACRATRVRGEASEATLDLRMRCLDDRRLQIGALVRVLADADAATATGAVSAVAALPTLADCANPRALAPGPALPTSPAARAEVAALADTAASANALLYAGKYAAAGDLARPALVRARTLGYAPLVAKLAFTVGMFEQDEQHFTASVEALHEAAAISLGAGDEAGAADAWTVLLKVVGFNLDRPAEARQLARYAASMIARLGDDEREATRLRSLATVEWRRAANYDEARALIDRARALYDRVHGAHYAIEVIACDEVLAGIAFDTGRVADALALHQRVADARRAQLGDEHPGNAISLVNVGEDLTQLGRAAEAVPVLRQALAAAASVHDHGGDAYELHRLAAALRATGDATAALAADDAALAGNARAGEVGNYWESWALTGRGLDLVALGRAREAIAPLERAVALRADHAIPVELATSELGLARALAATGDRERARSVARAARARLAADAARFGAYFAALLAEIDRFLAEA